VVDLVAHVVAEVAVRMAATKRSNGKNHTDADKVVKASHKGKVSMKLPPSYIASSLRRCAS
jgi:hypothetical protein